MMPYKVMLTRSHRNWKLNRKCKEYKELPADVAVVLTEKNIARMSCDSLELVTHLADIHQKATINLCKGETCEFASSRCPIYKYDTVCKHSMRGSPWVRKFGYLCIRRILVTSRDCASTWPPVYIPRAHQHEITQSSGTANQMQLKVLFGRKWHGCMDC